MSVNLIKQLPAWLQAGAFVLAINAGIINVLGLITLLHQSVSHMTGNVSILAMELINAEYEHVLFLTLITLCYVLGSFYSGFILADSQFRFGKRYGFPLCLVALFVFLCWFFLPYFPRYALLWASAAMGVQNAMLSYYKGGIIRTTHLSGVLTDLGLDIGYRLRGLHVDMRRFSLHLLLVLGFFVGGVIAAVIHPYLGLQSFLVSTVLSLGISLTYWLIYIYLKKQQGVSQ